MFYIEFNYQKNTDFGFAVAGRPSIPAPQMRGDYVQVAGRDGSLLVSDGTYENISIPVSLNYVSRPHKQGESFRRMKSWLRGPGIFRMSDDPDVFFKVKACGVTDNSRRHKVGSDCVAEFICDPYTFFDSGLVPLRPGKVYNPYDEAHPVYQIEGNGECTLTVNEKVLTANVSGNLTVDTDLFLAYKTVDGVKIAATTTGDFDDLYLNPTENHVSITSGFDLKIIPNWRAL